MKYTGISETGNIQEYQRQEISRNTREQEIYRNTRDMKYTGISETGNIKEYKRQVIYKNTRNRKQETYSYTGKGNIQEHQKQKL